MPMRNLVNAADTEAFAYGVYLCAVQKARLTLTYAYNNPRTNAHTQTHSADAIVTPK